MVILCSGNYAKTPYYFAEEDLHIYSVEELCYYLYKNAFLLTEDFFCEELLQWIQTQLGMEEEARELRALQKGEQLLQNSIGYLFARTGYYGSEHLQRVCRILEDGSRLSLQEKRKLRADAYCKHQKYMLAIEEYEEILKSCEAEQKTLRAKLFHNMGTAYAGLFLYKQAQECFWQAYQNYPNTESYLQCLMACKLCTTQEEYLSYLAKHPESYEDSLEVESRLKQAEQEWEKISAIDVVEMTRQEGALSIYAAENRLLQQAKKEYTKMVSKE